MPLVHFSVPAHLERAKVAVLADAVHAALVETCGVPPNDRFQLVSSFAEGAMIIDPTFPDMERSEDAVIIEIRFLAGRTDLMKRALYRRIADGAEAAGFRADDILVALFENTLIDWSLGRGAPYGGHPAVGAAGGGLPT